MKQAFAALLLLVVSFFGSANAAIPPQPKYVVAGTNYSDSTVQLACAGAGPAYGAAYGMTVDSIVWAAGESYQPNGVCVINWHTADNSGVRRTDISNQGSACPANSTGSSSCVCNTGFDEAGGNSCVAHANACTGKTGQVGVINWTEGYTRTGDEGDRGAVGPLTLVPSSGNVCSEGCNVSLQISGPGVQFYSSQQSNSQGLYRRSVDYPSLNMGTECTSSVADVGVKPDTPSPDCPGSVGDLNGRTVCVGTAAKPVTTVPLGAPSSPPIAGNPAAGPKPATGDGSGTGSDGRTPGAGSGGAGGGGTAAGVGGKGGGAGGTASGTGTRAAPAAGEQQAACGAPGEPVCAVKVDERGVPASAGASFDTANTSLDTAKDAAKAGIDAADSMQTPSWSFSFQLPTGCTPYNVNIKNFVLNPCQYQSTIHDLMSMIWAAVTAFCIIGMVGRTIRES